MYYDVFINSAIASIVENPEPSVDGILIEFAGPKSTVVYAVTSTRQFDPGAEGSPAVPLDIYHCLVTEEQLAQIEQDNIPLIPFPAISNAFLNPHGGPGHVFNPSGVVYRENGNTRLHRIKASEPEDISGE